MPNDQLNDNDFMNLKQKVTEHEGLLRESFRLHEQNTSTQKEISKSLSLIARLDERHTETNRRLNSHDGLFEKLFEKVEKNTTFQNRAMGAIALLVILIQVGSKFIQ